MTRATTTAPRDPATLLREATLALALCLGALAYGLYMASAPANMFPAIQPVIDNTAHTANMAMVSETVAVLGARLVVLVTGLMTPVVVLIWIGAFVTWRKRGKPSPVA